MDDEPMWVADRVVAPTPGSAITIPETANEFAIKALFDQLLGEIRAFSQHENESLTDDWLRMKEMLRNCHGSSNSDTDKIMARMDAMTIKMDAQYKELQSRAKQPTPDLNNDDMPMSYEEEQSTNAFVKETFMDLKTQLEIVAKNHQASIQNLETKFDRLANKQSCRPSRSLPSNTQPNPRGSKAYQPPQARNEHVNVVFTRSVKSYNPPDNPNDQ
ncbi:hypothetical protein Tco_0548815 [Tanacetum coccineum]